MLPPWSTYCTLNTHACHATLIVQPKLALELREGIGQAAGVDADRVLAKFSSTESRRLQAGTTDIELMYVVACEQVRSPCTRVRYRAAR